MEHEVLGYQSPLYGRRTSQLHLNGFSYLDVYKLLQGVRHEECLKYYACFGGTPHYLSQINKKISFEDNIKHLFFDVAGYMYNETSMLLQQELREPAFYNSIITVISSGATKITEIADKLHEDRTKVNKYIQTLIRLGILMKKCPFGEDVAISKKSIYEIRDNSYDFWYRFVFPNIGEIETGNGDIIADEIFEYDLSTYIGKKFENICKQYLIQQNLKNKLPFRSTAMGTWWGNDPVEKKEYDIDIIAANARQKNILIAECKWRNQLDDVAELMKIMSKEYLFGEYQHRWYYFFSKIPYSEQAQILAKEKGNITLLTYDDLFDDHII